MRKEVYIREEERDVLGDVQRLEEKQLQEKEKRLKEKNQKATKEMRDTRTKEREKEKPFSPKGVSHKLLQEKLQKAIDEEEYEQAALLRDKIMEMEKNI